MSDVLVKENHRGHPPASNLAFNEKVKLLRASGQEVCHLAFGQSPFSIPEPLVEALKENAHRHEYLSVQGLPELRESLSQFHKLHDGVDFKPDEVIVAPGSKELIFLAMKLFNGNVILASPAWTTYAPQARLANHGKEPLMIQTDFESGFKVTPETLREAIKDKGHDERYLMIINNPGNPSGTSYSKEELCALEKACEELNVTVLLDEIYGWLRFDGNHTCGLKVFSNCILTSGFSKWSSAGGWRVGYAVVRDAALRQAMVSAASHTYSCAPAPMQAACAQALSNNVKELEDYMKSCRQVLKLVADCFVEELRSVGVKVHPSTSGYYLFPDFEICRAGLKAAGVETSKQMCDKMLEEAKVAFLPGSANLREPTELTVRLCYVDFDGDAFLRVINDGKELTHEHLAQLAPGLIAGLDRIKSFVRKYSGKTSAPYTNGAH